MAAKFVVVVLAALSIASASSDRVERQSGGPDLSEYFNKFQEQMKPIAGQFPKPPSGGFGGLPSFPSFGGSSAGSSGGGSRLRREATPSMIEEWLGQFQGSGNNFGNLPFKPPQFGQFGQFPSFPGSASGSGETSENQNS